MKRLFGKMILAWLGTIALQSSHAEGCFKDEPQDVSSKASTKGEIRATLLKKWASELRRLQELDLQEEPETQAVVSGAQELATDIAFRTQVIEVEIASIKRSLVAADHQIDFLRRMALDNFSFRSETTSMDLALQQDGFTKNEEARAIDDLVNPMRYHLLDLQKFVLQARTIFVETEKLAEQSLRGE